MDYLGSIGRIEKRDGKRISTFQIVDRNFSGVEGNKHCLNALELKNIRAHFAGERILTDANMERYTEHFPVCENNCAFVLRAICTAALLDAEMSDEVLIGKLFGELSLHSSIPPNAQSVDPVATWCDNIVDAESAFWFPDKIVQ